VDVEKTIEFILQEQAKSELRHAKAEASIEAAEKRWKARADATEKRLDKRMDAISKLLHQGMRMLVTYQDETKEKINALIDSQMRLDAKMEELAAAQKDTQRTLKAFIASLQKGRNGKGRNGH